MVRAFWIQYLRMRIAKFDSAQHNHMTSCRSEKKEETLDFVTSRAENRRQNTTDF